MALEREVGAVELQEEAVADDRLVFDPQRVREGIEVSLLGIVVFVLHGRGDDAGRGCGQERLDEAARGLIEHGPKVRAFGIDGRQVEVADLPDRLGGWKLLTAVRRAICPSSMRWKIG